MSLFVDFCNVCGIKTKHSVLHQVENKIYTDSGSIDGDFSIDRIESYEILNCENCDAKSFRIQSDYGYATNGDLVIFTTSYPSHQEGVIQQKEFAGMTQNIKKAYREVLHNYNFDMALSCASGLRTLIEGLCTHFQIADKDSNGRPVALGNRIRELATKRLISSVLADALRAHKELGNDAVHNLVAPSKEELKLAIGLIETAFENLFNVSKQHEELGGRMTRRMLPE